jgi:tricarballylate dehydrogenase
MASASPPPIDLSQTFANTFDVLIIGGGNAALCAAISAARANANAKILVLESAPKAFRGGNSRHTRNLRYLHKHATDVLTGPYDEAEFWDDLLRVTGGKTNEGLARFTLRESTDLGVWMETQGCRFQAPLRGTLNLSRTNAFFLGGGKALLNAYYHTAHKLGVQVAYDTQVHDLSIQDGRFSSAIIHPNNGTDTQTQEVRAKSVVVASGGFEANIPWLKEYWGEAADNFIIRGTPYNTGRMLRVLLDSGAKPVGDPRQCHAVAIDARAPKFDGGIVTRLDCVPFGIVVNTYAKRFYDEGEDFWPKRYAIWGRIVAQQPNQIAYSIIDAKAIGKFMPSVFPPIEASSIEELATHLELEPSALADTVAGFNAATRPGTFDPSVLDACATHDLVLPKSHWAIPLDTPPFYGYPLRPGITFTYLGVTVNEHAQVIMHNEQNERPASNIYAAGEVMAGNILGQGYMAGFGMTIGTVFGRIAGRQAVQHAID